MMVYTNKRRLTWKFYTLMLLCILGLALSGVASASAASTSGDGPPSFANLAEKVKHSVVNVATTQVIEGNPLVPFF